MNHRTAGVLLHPTSLPGPWGAGDFGSSAVEFLDWAAEAGFRLWQILPLGPSAAGNSPYTALSAFAIDPFLISLERLVDDGLLDLSDLEGAGVANTGHCDFQAMRAAKAPLLRKAWLSCRDQPSEEIASGFTSFCDDTWHRAWLDDWCLFQALRRRYDQAGWWTWDEPLARREESALATLRHEQADDIGFERFLQVVAYRQWGQLREAARERGIQVMGDVPIYVAQDSAEVWAHPELFELDENNRPTAVAGVPPDYFSADGQLWGNPLYRWGHLAETGFRFWVERLQANLEIADLVRLDHFRGFAGYWRVPAAAETARDGEWAPGPGLALFHAFRDALGEPLPLIAEDLGEITDDVHELRRDAGLPSMKVLQFGFSEPQTIHAPHHLEEPTLVYTGTHDNDTAVGWFGSLSEDEQRRITTYLGGVGETIHRDLVRAALTSVARWAVVPVQDVLGLGQEARMNTPGIADGNWSWRLKDLLGPADAQWVRELVALSDRQASHGDD
ncbi:MAG: 4-alpha-glucanotransferase [Acidobacteriota bacterium]